MRGANEWAVVTGFLAGMIRQRYRPMKRIQQITSADVLDLMFVLIRVVAERTVVVPEP